MQLEGAALEFTPLDREESDMQNKPTIAVAIFALGSLGLFAALVLAVLAFMDPPRGVAAPMAALAYLPHIFGALLMMGAAEALALLADIARETARHRAEADTASRNLRETIKAQALAAEERELPWEMLDRAHKAGWAIEAKGQGQWTAKHPSAYRTFPHRGALEDFIRTLPPAA